MPTPGSATQIALRLLEHFERQHRGTGGEIVNARQSWSSLQEYPGVRLQLKSPDLLPLVVS